RRRRAPRRSRPRSGASRRRCAPPPTGCVSRRRPRCAIGSSTSRSFWCWRPPEMETPARLKIDDLPDSPGVYLYRDGGGKVIYVGQANSLTNRVRSYFQESTSWQAPKTDALLSDIHDPESIVRPTQVEALLP